ncbi:hypothetical protein [Cohnella fermenti]|uniref:hypothetical protein n=1 Tax=Cohnella fermenti TaxID=2565925 RepID=UPI001454CAA3|nr:hypothetical protein [Cohnella fermenti]
MSRLHIGIVSEGNTDQAVLEGLLLHIVKEHQFIFNSLQPEQGETEGFGIRGGGWKGVARWCETIPQKGGLTTYLSTGSSLDLLIIQIDGDVVREADSLEYNGENTVIEISLALEKWLKSLLNEDALPDGSLFVITVDSLESWALAAFIAEKGLDVTAIEPIELVNNPASVLIRNPYKLLKTKDGAPFKNRRYYEKNVVPLIIKHWEFVKQHCIQAAKFDQAITGWLAAM